MKQPARQRLTEALSPLCAIASARFLQSSSTMKDLIQDCGAITRTTFCNINQDMCPAKDSSYGHPEQSFSCTRGAAIAIIPSQSAAINSASIVSSSYSSTKLPVVPLHLHLPHGQPQRDNYSRSTREPSQRTHHCQYTARTGSVMADHAGRKGHCQ